MQKIMIPSIEYLRSKRETGSLKSIKKAKYPPTTKHIIKGSE